MKEEELVMKIMKHLLVSKLIGFAMSEDNLLRALRQLSYEVSD